jgi:hypothetical protein
MYCSMYNRDDQEPAVDAGEHHHLHRGGGGAAGDGGDHDRDAQHPAAGTIIIHLLYVVKKQ